MIITRKIQLLIDEEDKEKYKDVWRYLRKLNDEVFKAANLVVSNKYFNDAFTDRILLSDEELSEKKEEIDKKIKEVSEKIRDTKDEKAKEKLHIKIKRFYNQLKTLTKEAREKAYIFYCTSERNTTYQLLNNHFPEMPACIKAAISNTVSKNYVNDWIDVKRGKRSIRNYRKDLPIPFMKASMRFEQTDSEIFMKWIKNINFKLNFGRDKSNNEEIVKRVLNETYGYGDSSIKITDRKIFLLLVVKLPDVKKELDEDLSIGVDLGVNIPAYCAISKGFERLPIGTREEFLKIRTQMQSRRTRVQRALKLSKGGKGRNKKLKALELLKSKERNFVHTYNHMVSFRIVNFAVRCNAGKIKLELLEGYSDEDRSNFILRNWSYFELQNLIKYKADKEGIKFLFIDPYHTSQTCALCGHYEEGQRTEQKTFKCKNTECKNFDKEVSADYNAAMNIARSEKYVENKEDCYYYKSKEVQ